VSELADDLGRLTRGPPTGGLGAIAPSPGSVERMHADAIELVHRAHPRRMHPIGMIVGGLADFREPEAAIERCCGDLRGAGPRLGLVDDVGNAIAREGKLASEVAIGVLIDDATDRAGIVA